MRLLFFVVEKQSTRSEFVAWKHLVKHWKTNALRAFLCIKKYNEKEKKGVDEKKLFKYYVYKESYLAEANSTVTYNFV